MGVGIESASGMSKLVNNFFRACDGCKDYKSVKWVLRPERVYYAHRSLYVLTMPVEWIQTSFPRGPPLVLGSETSLPNNFSTPPQQLLWVAS